MEMLAVSAFFETGSLEGYICKSSSDPAVVTYGAQQTNNEKFSKSVWKQKVCYLSGDS
jgi:hypothetical protein